MVNVEWALRSAWFLNTNLSNLTKFSPRGGFVFPQITQIFTDFWLLAESLLWALVSTVACNEENLCKSVRSVGDSFWITMQRYNISFSQLTDAHRCSLLLTDTHRLSLINIRVLPNGRKYRILAEDWTPCSSCCIHSSAAARRAGCILLSISSDGLLPRPGRNPENRAGLTPAWCNFVNPFSL